MNPKLSGLKQRTLFFSSYRSRDPRAAQVGDDGSGSLLRLSSVYWPGLESSEGLNGAGGPAARLCHIRAW